MLFNNTSKSYVTVLRGRERPFFAPLSRDSKFDSKLITTDRGHRIITVPIWIKYKKMDEFRELTEDLASWLVHSEPKILEFSDEPDRFYWAVVDDTMNEDVLYNTGTETVITFVCGYKYSQDKEIEVIVSRESVISGHTSTNWKTEATFSKNRRNYTFEIKSNGDDLRDKTVISLNYNFIEGDVLKVDYSKRLVTVNGIDITNTLVIKNSNFKELPIGDVEFSATETTRVLYNERYY